MAVYTKSVCVRCGKEERLRKPRKYERILITICPEHGKPTPEDWAKVKELRNGLADPSTLGETRAQMDGD